MTPECPHEHQRTGPLPLVWPSRGFDLCLDCGATRECERTTIDAPAKLGEWRPLATATIALLTVEWVEGAMGEENWGPLCPECRAPGPDFVGDKVAHRLMCALDAALTEARLPDQASRDDAREAAGLRRW